MAVKVRVDEHGRIIIPKEIAIKLGLKPGSELLLEVSGDKIIVEKYDPFKKLASILGNISYDKSIRKNAEDHALRELMTSTMVRNIVGSEKSSRTR